MGTKIDLAACKSAGDGLGCSYWEVWDTFSKFTKAKPGEKTTAAFCTIQPVFSLLDKQKAEPFMKQCVEATATEEGCVYYGLVGVDHTHSGTIAASPTPPQLTRSWTISDDGSKLYCREAYVDGTAVDVHLKVRCHARLIPHSALTLDQLLSRTRCR